MRTAKSPFLAFEARDQISEKLTALDSSSKENHNREIHIGDPPVGMILKMVLSGVRGGSLE